MKLTGKNFAFDFSTFFRIIIVYFLMTVLCSVVCYLMDKHYGENRFFVKAVGFIALYCLPFIIGLRIYNLSKILLLVGIFFFTGITIYLFGALLLNITHNSLVWGIVMSATSSIILTVSLNRLKIIYWLYTCILTTTLMALPTYLIPQSFFESFYFDYDIHPSIVMFNVLEGLTIIPLSLGLSIDKR